MTPAIPLIHNAMATNFVPDQILEEAIRDRKNPVKPGKIRKFFFRRTDREQIDQHPVNQFRVLLFFPKAAWIQQALSVFFCQTAGIMEK
jgi:hypothetical protein